MKRLNFTKMVATGNDFVVIDARSGAVRQILGMTLKDKGSLSKSARIICQRRTSVGADGILILEKSKTADFKMRIFNADGTEAEMCGNGLRCAVLFRAKKGKIKVETIAGLYGAEIKSKDRVEIKMEEPKDIKEDLKIVINDRNIRVNYVDTGVPHAVIFVQGVDDIDVDSIGREIRYHERFKPRGTNVDFVEIIDDKNIKMRTYERGVEGETLACGTGAVASAVMTGFKSQGSKFRQNVHTKGGVLEVSFIKKDRKIKEVYLDGEAKIVYKGEVDYV